MSVRVCRECGCTHLTPCYTVTAKKVDLLPIEQVEIVVLRNITRAIACWWIEDDLCSACQRVKVITEFDLLHVSIDAQPNAFGESIEIIEEEERGRTTARDLPEPS